jgi:hypothetical protein
MTDQTPPAYCAGLTNFPTMAPTVTPDTPDNDDCTAATLITVGSTTRGSTISATNDNVGFCGTINSGPGIWYKIVGDGSFYSVDTCQFTNFDTRISIFKGATCAARVCVTGNDQSTDFDCQATGASRAKFDTEPGVTYFILVHGNFDFKGTCRKFHARANDIVVVILAQLIHHLCDPRLPTGGFELTVTSFAPPANDFCADATTIGLGSTTPGTTVGATGDGLDTDGCDSGGKFSANSGKPCFVECNLVGISLDPPTRQRRAYGTR